MTKMAVLKAISDETRMNIILLLLQHNYCVRAISRKLSLSESAISQHIKVLREANILVGAKHGYFMHYNVNKDTLCDLAEYIKSLTEIEQNTCAKECGQCGNFDKKECKMHKKYKQLSCLTSTESDGDDDIGK